MRILIAGFTTLLMVLAVNAAQAKTHAGSSCDLSSEGIFRGSWVKHRILVADDVVYGANDMEAISSQLESLRGQGLCQ